MLGEGVWTGLPIHHWGGVQPASTFFQDPKVIDKLADPAPPVVPPPGGGCGSPPLLRSSKKLLVPPLSPAGCTSWSAAVPINGQGQSFTCAMTDRGAPANLLYFCRCIKKVPGGSAPSPIHWRSNGSQPTRVPSGEGKRSQPHIQCITKYQK